MHMHAAGAPGLESTSEGVWWGENLYGARASPVRLRDPSRLVLSPHTYGPGVYAQPYFNAPDFPSNLARVWEAHFASAAEEEVFLA